MYLVVSRSTGDYHYMMFDNHYPATVQPIGCFILLTNAVGLCIERMKLHRATWAEEGKQGPTRVTQITSEMRYDNAIRYGKFEFVEGFAHVSDWKYSYNTYDREGDAHHTVILDKSLVLQSCEVYLLKPDDDESEIDHIQKRMSAK